MLRLRAAVHSGYYSDLNEAAKQMVQIAELVEPNPSFKQAYDDSYAKYLATYPALRELMHDTAV